MSQENNADEQHTPLSADVLNETQQKMTHNIIIEVETNYIEEQSDPANSRYIFAYTISIQNHGNIPATLMTRHWVITDANAKTQEVRGEGVVGEQPHLDPDQGFRYTSGTVLETPVGSMSGSYQMVDDNGEYFDAEIPTFTLSVPRIIN